MISGKEIKLPELLAPVGGRAQLEAAVNNGADAVYMGGSLFNARINAENFTDASLRDAIDFAHERGVKVYITFNTLVKDSELARAFRYACFLYETGADALILQDMGLARLLHKYLPDFPLHLSTQGTVYNVQALDLVRRLGFCRVVPARELSLAELRRLCAAARGDSSTSLEVEVFVHGALCMCYSGQCQMSRAFGGGGRSGNRGLCAQPCRLPYTDDTGRTGYFLSPKDLCALERIPQLIEAGVDSFKIEGRLKSPEYVAVTTAVYRKYLDLYAETIGVDTHEGAAASDTAAASGAAITPAEWKRMIDPADMQKLRQIFNRGGFTTGYLDGNPGKKILSGESPKNQGVYVGTVKSVRPVRSKSAGRDKVLVDVMPKGGVAASGGAASGGACIAHGDGVELRGRAGEAGAATGNVVTYAEKLPDGTWRIGDFDRGIRPGDRVYKVTDKALREEALAAPAKSLPLRMCFRAKAGKAPEITLSLGDAQCGARDDAKVRGDFAVEKALKRPTTAEKIRSQLMKLGDTCFCAAEEDIAVDIDPDIMIPVSVINQMRREAAEMLAEKLRVAATAARTPLPEERIEEIIAEEQLGSEEEMHRVKQAASQLRIRPVPVQEFCAEGFRSQDRGAERSRSQDRGAEGSQSSNEDALPYILNVSKGALDEYIEENFDTIARLAQDTGILIGNLGWIKQFRDAGVTVYGDFGLNAYNSQCVKAYEELGVKMLYPSYECFEGGRGSGMQTEDTRFGGRVPLMITEHPFRTDYLVDRKGAVHEIIKCEDKYVIL